MLIHLKWLTGSGQEGLSKTAETKHQLLSYLLETCLKDKAGKGMYASLVCKCLLPFTMAIDNSIQNLDIQLLKEFDKWLFKVECITICMSKRTSLSKTRPSNDQKVCNVIFHLNFAGLEA